MVLKETGHGVEWGEESPAETCCEPGQEAQKSFVEGLGKQGEMSPAS